MAHNIMGMDPCDGENHEIFNTTSQKRTFVDARTGLFEVYVPLPPVTCNNGLGPVIDMSLFYTPMVNNRAGLGDGWSFAFTTYDEKRQQLRLHSGEAVEVSRDESLGTTTIIACWSEDKTTLTVKRPDGRVEVLKQVEDSGIFTPIRLSLDGINFASLEWSAKEWISASDSYRHVRLIGIDDDYDQLSEDTKVKPLHHDDYVNKYRQVHIEYPERGEADLQIKIKYWQYDDIAANTYHLALKDFALREVILPGGDKFAFSYDDHPTCGWLLNEVVTPEGLSESVEYVDNGLPFKDDEKLSALPCVSTHTVRPVNGASVVETTYEYFSEPVVPINEVHRELSSIGVPVLHYGGVFSVPISDDMNCDFSEAVDGYIEFVKLKAINESLSGTEFDQLEPDCDLVSVYGHYWYRTVVVCGDRHEEILYTHKHQVFSSTVFGAGGPRDKVVVEYHVLGDSILTQETSPNKVSASSQVYYTKGLMTRRETAERTVAWSYDRAEHLVDTKDKYNYVFTLARMTAEAVSYPQGGGITTHYTYGKTGIRPLSREVVLSNDATKKLKHSYLYGERGLS